jgi:hypothetical protein
MDQLDPEIDSYVRWEEEYEDFVPILYQNKYDKSRNGAACPIP